jgi:hypothetical protein
VYAYRNVTSENRYTVVSTATDARTRGAAPPWSPTRGGDPRGDFQRGDADWLTARALAPLAAGPSRDPLPGFGTYFRIWKTARRFSILDLSTGSRVSDANEYRGMQSRANLRCSNAAARRGPLAHSCTIVLSSVAITIKNHTKERRYMTDDVQSRARRASAATKSIIRARAAVM